jgi:hypothetical protein
VSHWSARLHASRVDPATISLMLGQVTGMSKVERVYAQSLICARQ